MIEWSLKFMAYVVLSKLHVASPTFKSCIDLSHRGLLYSGRKVQSVYIFNANKPSQLERPLTSCIGSEGIVCVFIFLASVVSQVSSALLGTLASPPKQSFLSCTYNCNISNNAALCQHTTIGHPLSYLLEWYTDMITR